MYSGSMNGVNFALFMGFWGELREICIIRWKFCQKTKPKFEKFFACKFKNEETNVYGYAVPYFSQKIWTFCREASLPFPEEMDCWVVA